MSAVKLIRCEPSYASLLAISDANCSEIRNENYIMLNTSPVVLRRAPHTQRHVRTWPAGKPTDAPEMWIIESRAHSAQHGAAQDDVCRGDSQQFPDVKAAQHWASTLEPASYPRPSPILGTCSYNAMLDAHPHHLLRRIHLPEMHPRHRLASARREHQPTFYGRFEAPVQQPQSVLPPPPQQSQDRHPSPPQPTSHEADSQAAQTQPVPPADINVVATYASCTATPLASTTSIPPPDDPRGAITTHLLRTCSNQHERSAEHCLNGGNRCGVAAGNPSHFHQRTSSPQVHPRQQLRPCMHSVIGSIADVRPADMPAPEPRARPDLALLAQLPPLQTLASPNHLATDLSSLSQQLDCAVQSLSVLSSLSCLSTLACLQTALDSTATTTRAAAAAVANAAADFALASGTSAAAATTAHLHNQGGRSANGGLKRMSSSAQGSRGEFAVGRVARWAPQGAPKSGGPGSTADMAVPSVPCRHLSHQRSNARAAVKRGGSSGDSEGSRREGVASEMMIPHRPPKSWPRVQSSDDQTPPGSPQPSAPPVAFTSPPVATSDRDAPESLHMPSGDITLEKQFQGVFHSNDVHHCGGAGSNTAAGAAAAVAAAAAINGAPMSGPVSGVPPSSDRTARAPDGTDASSEMASPALVLSDGELEQLVVETARASAAAVLELYHAHHVQQLQQQLRDCQLYRTVNYSNHPNQRNLSNHREAKLSLNYQKDPFQLKSRYNSMEITAQRVITSTSEPVVYGSASGSSGDGGDGGRSVKRPGSTATDLDQSQRAGFPEVASKMGGLISAETASTEAKPDVVASSRGGIPGSGSNGAEKATTMRHPEALPAPKGANNGSGGGGSSRRKTDSSNTSWDYVTLYPAPRVAYMGEATAVDSKAKVPSYPVRLAQSSSATGTDSPAPAPGQSFVRDDPAVVLVGPDAAPREALAMNEQSDTGLLQRSLQFGSAVSRSEPQRCPDGVLHTDSASTDAAWRNPPIGEQHFDTDSPATRGAVNPNIEPIGISDSGSSIGAIHASEYTMVVFHDERESGVSVREVVDRSQQLLELAMRCEVTSLPLTTPTPTTPTPTAAAAYMEPPCDDAGPQALLSSHGGGNGGQQPQGEQAEKADSKAADESPERSNSSSSPLEVASAGMYNDARQQQQWQQQIASDSTSNDNDDDVVPVAAFTLYNDDFDTADISEEETLQLQEQGQPHEMQEEEEMYSGVAANLGTLPAASVVRMSVDNNSLRVMDGGGALPLEEPSDRSLSFSISFSTLVVSTDAASRGTRSNSGGSGGPRGGRPPPAPAPAPAPAQQSSRMSIIQRVGT